MTMLLKLFLPMLFAIALGLLVLHGYWAPKLYESDKDDFISQTNRELSAMENGLIENILTNDFAAIFVSLDKQLEKNTGRWLSLNLYNRHDKRLYPLFQTNDKHTAHVNHDWVEFDIISQGEKIAWMKVEIDLSKSIENTTDQIIELEKMLFIISIVGIMFILYTQNRFVLRPLKNLMQATERLTQGEYDVPLPITGNDEVGRLTQAFEEMRIERRKGEIDLQEQRFALDQHAIVAITDVKGIITFANERFSEITGYSNKELVGKNHRLIKSDFHKTDFFKNMYQRISKGKTWHGELCNRNKSGERYWVDTTIVPFMGADGKPKSYIAIRTDITARKVAESALTEALRKAQEAVDAKSEFLASMSHEIRTPMNGVLGMLGLLLNTKLTEDQLHRVTVAQSSANALLTIINDILDFSKVEAGKLELEYLDFNLRQMLGEFVESIAHQAEGKGLELVLNTIHIEESMVKGDPGRIRQILTNIVGNAIKFTAQGEIIIYAEIQDIDDQYCEFHCRITDSGIGVPADKIDSLFSSFTQVDTSTTRRFGGTGLGLAIVKKLCELMDGEIKVTSELNKGSCFSFTVRLQKSTHSKRVLPKVDIGQLKLLVVDDNAANREVLSEQLKFWGASVVETSSGAEALDKCAELSQQTDESFFDIALLDMQMPDMDGAELGQRLKSNDQYSTMRLIMMTSMGHQGDAAYFSNLGFHGYFSKPTTTSDLLDALSVVADGGVVMKEATPLVTSHYVRALGRNNNESTEKEIIKWSENTRLLLVEDNHVNQLVVVGILEGVGLHADVAANGLEALDCLRSAPSDSPYTLVLMDCQMPEMDGYQASEAIRNGNAGTRNIEIPIIALTANAMFGDREKCLQSGMDDYLSKPIDPNKLFTLLKQWINGEGNDAGEKNNNEEELSKNNSSEPAADPIVWDKEASLNRIMGKEPLLDKLVDAFLQEAPKYMTTIQSAIDSGDKDQVQLTAHAMKSMAANVGGVHLNQLAAEMEAAARDSETDKIIEIWPNLQHVNKRLTECFEEYKNERES